MKVLIVNNQNKKVIRWYPKKFFKNILMLLMILIGIWFVASYIQVMCHQVDYLKNGIHFVYPNWNAFIWIANNFQCLK